MRKLAYSFKLSSDFLSKKEQSVFDDFLKSKGYESNIWLVFESLFKSGLKGNTPLILRSFMGDELIGAAIVIKCSKYGKALFNNKILVSILSRSNIPFYLWIRFGCCMDMMSNPGFIKYPEKADEILSEMASFLCQNHLLTFITDYSINNKLYSGYTELPSLPHAIIDCSRMKSINDYIGSHKNIKRKMNILRNKGGNFEIIPEQLSKSDIYSLEKCFVATAEKSIFYLPYQDIYLNSAKNTSNTRLKDVYYFVVRLNDVFIGYQAVIKTGSHLNALHGAFDRNRNSNYHAYNVLFVKMTEFAIENGINNIDFGAVLNTTKQRMINKTIEMSYFIGSKYKFVQALMTMFLKVTKIQGKKQLKYRTSINSKNEY